MKLEIHKKELKISLSFWESVWSIKRSLVVRLDQITEVNGNKPKWGWLVLRLPGTFVPGVIRAGSYWTKRGWEFWYAVRKRPFVTLELRDHHYKRIILTTRDADKWMKQINAAVTRNS